MPDESTRTPRSRPVDVLFGEPVELKPKATSTENESRAPQAPGYMVEPPRPVTSLRPPPPELPNDWHVTTPPEVVNVAATPTETVTIADAVIPPPPVMTEPPQPEPIAEAVSFTLTERAEAPKPAFDDKLMLPLEPALMLPIPAPAALLTAPASLYGQTELLELSQFVDQLYQNVADETSDSKALNAECLAHLSAARRAIEKGEYARAEVEAEQVKARLLRARASRAGAVAPNTRILFAWLIVAFLGGLAMFLVPVALRLVPAMIPVIRAMGLSMCASAAAALWHLTRRIAEREYDVAFLLKYSALPVLGAALGVVLVLLSLLGILAAPGALGIQGEPWLMYLFAFFAGWFSDALFDAVRQRTSGRATQ